MHASRALRPVCTHTYVPRTACALSPSCFPKGALTYPAHKQAQSLAGPALVTGGRWPVMHVPPHTKHSKPRPGHVPLPANGHFHWPEPRHIAITAHTAMGNLASSGAPHRSALPCGSPTSQAAGSQQRQRQCQSGLRRALVVSTIPNRLTSGSSNDTVEPATKAGMPAHDGSTARHTHTWHSKARSGLQTAGARNTKQHIARHRHSPVVIGLTTAAASTDKRVPYECTTHTHAHRVLPPVLPRV